MSRPHQIDAIEITVGDLLGHMNDTGKRMKAEYLGKRIIDDEERTLLKAP